MPRESPENIAAHNKRTNERVSRIVNTMITYRLRFGDAVDFINNEDAFEEIEDFDIVKLIPVEDEPL